MTRQRRMGHPGPAGSGRAASALIVIALAGCAAGTGDTTTPAATAGAGPGSPVAATGLESVIAAATRDATARLAVDPAQIVVLRAEQVTWSDGSLGCPAPGMQYTQALVPGYRIQLRAAGETLDYHAAANGRVAWCPPGQALEPVAREPV